MGRLLDLAVSVETEAAVATSWRWRLHFPDREPMEVFVWPEATHDEVLAAYPAAIAAEPLPESPPAAVAGLAGKSADPEALARPEDDRRNCRQCRHLGAAGVCSIAAPCGLVLARRGYMPLPDLLRRCEGYLPPAADSGQRPGAERWRGLTP